MNTATETKTETHNAITLEVTLANETQDELQINVIHATETFKQGEFLEFAYKTIGTNLIDVVGAVIQGHTVDIWVDDEGLYREPVRELSTDGTERALGFIIGDDHGNRTPLVGALVFTGVDEHGGTVSPSIDEATVLKWVRDGRITPAGIPLLR